MIFSTLPSQQPFVYTWATKPPAAGNAGLEIIISDFANSRWRSNGTNWVPANVKVVVYEPDVSGLQVQAATLAPVAAIAGWQMPSDLASTPGLYIEGWFVGVISSTSNAQQRQINCGVTGAESFVFRHQFTSVSSFKRAWGVSFRGDASSSAWYANGTNTTPNTDGNSGGDASIAQITANPIRLYYQGGDTSGAEVLTCRKFSLAIGRG